MYPEVSRFAFFQQKNRLYDDVLPTLQRLKAADVPMGVLTDVAYGMPSRLLESDIAPIAPYMDAILSSVDVGWRKPEKLGLLKLAESLDVTPSEMIYVGNEQKDMDAAKSAGVTSVLIDREGDSEVTGADRVISSLVELKNEVGEWTGWKNK